MQVVSLYWDGAIVPDEDRGALRQLHDTQRPVHERKAALVHLFGSSSAVARGIALDFYSISNTNLRHGNEPMLDVVVDAAARACALSELANPPYGQAEPNARLYQGANHASALHALWFNADHGDAAMLARVLTENADKRVLTEAVAVAEPVLRGQPAHPALTEALLRIVHRGDIDPRTRAHALAAIGGAADDMVEPLLVAAMANPELAVSAAAGRRLLERDLERYRNLVVPIAAAWSTEEFPPFDVHEVHRLLQGD